MSGIVKLVGSGVGIAKEYRAYRKASKAADIGDSPVQEGGLEYAEMLPAHHGLAYQSGNLKDVKNLDPPPYREEAGHDMHIPTPSIQQLPEVPAAITGRRLPMPVILPQRRPRNNNRGFVRAYAPILLQCGIDQVMWFDFLNGFHEALKMTPLFHVANAAVAIGSIPIPSMAVQVSAFAVGAALEISSKQFTKYQTNKYLDNMNADLFKPRGLYAAIMTFEPDSPSAAEVVDINTNTVQGVSGIVSSRSSRFRSSSGKTYGEIQLPEAAPLVYPDLNELPEQQRTNKMNKTGFLDDYLDRRAQAKFEMANPGSKLLVPRKGFASSWSDPTHPVHGADSLRNLVGAMQGGAGQCTRQGPGLQQREGEESPSGLKRVMQKPILYLMVVNMPNEEEFRIANSMLGQVRRY